MTKSRWYRIAKMTTSHYANPRTMKHASSIVRFVKGTCGGEEVTVTYRYTDTGWTPRSISFK